ncbi:putative pectinesterase 52 [Juglans regia]|uniref:pectinesterase n=1 Tax=Juglans regia TaxID=51240 RepID=A0A6P9EY36_JUGRE|nr:putative pectinesterase 52 [Juglans regia]
MQLLPPFIFILILSAFSFRISSAVVCRNGQDAASKVAYTLTVNKYSKPGPAIFNTIEAAINTIPPNNDQWVRVFISPGIYNEKVSLLQYRHCIFLEGKGHHLTIITYNDHEETDQSATFTSYVENLIVKGITFKNSFNRQGYLDFYNKRTKGEVKIKQAVAARIYGDKSAFYGCGFIGFQDTLWDATGRHYYKNCYIEGGVDFIWGTGQSIYEDCLINATAGTLLSPDSVSYVTAQGRNSSGETSGFVFRRGIVFGTGRILLGRAYGLYSRVIFHNTILERAVAPEGWDAWNSKWHEDKLTYAEVDCKGPGSDTSKRVKWMKKLRPSELYQFSTPRFINQDGWLDSQPLS